MKLAYRIISRISLALIILLTIWATLFYFIIVEEINDETDDMLEDYSEYIITHALAGEPLPSKDNGTNNSYHIVAVSPAYAVQHSGIRYHDEMVYLRSKRETEPARVLKTIFCNAENHYYELTVAVPSIEKEDLQEAILYWIIFLYIGLLIVITGLNWIVLQRNFKPLYKLLDWLNAFRVEQQFFAPKIQTRTTEFRKLNDAVLRSARRNIETYEQQKLFIGHASHELQTPLAVALNRLEMLTEDPQLTTKQLAEILKTRQSLDYAVKLNKTLLLLTKIKNNQFPGKKEIAVNEWIKKWLDDYSEVYAARNISVTWHEDASLHIEMNETLASVLFGNLLKNAFFHNCANGSINISITPASISIANTGAEEALNPATVFDRFSQTVKKEGSTGLGLALSKSVCDLYGMDLRYAFSEGKHIFSLFFH